MPGILKRQEAGIHRRARRRDDVGRRGAEEMGKPETIAAVLLLIGPVRVTAITGSGRRRTVEWEPRAAETARERPQQENTDVQGKCVHILFSARNHATSSVEEKKRNNQFISGTHLRQKV